MTDETIPPTYPLTANGAADSSADSSPPSYTPPSMFTIGSTTANEPLVDLGSIRGHLALLNRFSKLKIDVEAKVFTVPDVPEDKERKWAWFVRFAVERFDIWCKSLEPYYATANASLFLPPIDVIMVWHSYMLNPRWYAEDCMRLPACKNLKTMEPVFSELMRHPSILFTHPEKSRVVHWMKQTNLWFDPLEAIGSMISKMISCPVCGCSIGVDYMKHDGSGYLQQGFSVECPLPNCAVGTVTKDKLALAKLAHDIAVRSTGEPESSLAGSFFTSSTSDVEKGKKVKKRIYNAVKKKSRPKRYTPGTSEYHHELCLAIMKNCKYSLPMLRHLMTISPKFGPLVGRIMSAYNNDRIYSVELVGAVLRQGSFVDKMYDLGWTSPGYFDNRDDELALHHALARYHAFLDLMSSSPDSFFVPTLDIDLVWHTHQLSPNKYGVDCSKHLGRFIDHEDKVEGIRLSSAFDITCRAWKERFNIQYTHCGCPVPGDTIGQRLLHIVGIYSQPSSPPSHLTPFDRPDLLSATHPSDHNAVRFIGRTPYAQELATRRYEKFAKKKQKERQKAAKKEANALIHVEGGVVERDGASYTHCRDQHRSRVYSHNTVPFLVPVPIIYGAGTVGAGTCVSAGAYTAGSTAGCGACGSVSACGGGFSGGTCGGGGGSGGGIGGCGGGGGGGCGGSGGGGGCGGGGGGGGGCGGGGGGGGGCGGGGGGGGASGGGF